MRTRPRTASGVSTWASQPWRGGPPCWDLERDYGPGFDRAAFTHLSDQLRGLQGRFVLSLNDVSEVRELFDWATIKAVRTTYTLHRGASKKAGEVIISSR